MSTRTFIERFNKGDFAKPDFTTQCEAGWYDWFCKDTSLMNKTIKMGNIVKQINVGGKIDLEKTYVWFKNNCPANGPLFDDFRFADLESGDTLITIQIDCYWNDRRYTVFGKINDFETPLFESDTVKELVNWLNNPWEVK